MNPVHLEAAQYLRSLETSDCFGYNVVNTGEYHISEFPLAALSLRSHRALVLYDGAHMGMVHMDNFVAAEPYLEEMLTHFSDDVKAIVVGGYRIDIPCHGCAEFDIPVVGEHNDQHEYPYLKRFVYEFDTKDVIAIPQEKAVHVYTPEGCKKYLFQ